MTFGLTCAIPRKHIDNMSVPGCTSGCYFAGVVEEVGSKVTKAWKKGDRIAGFTHGANQVQLEDGCFAEYCVAKGDLGTKVFLLALSPTSYG